MCDCNATQCRHVFLSVWSNLYLRCDMATSSLYTDLNIDTPEAARNMELAFQKADRGEINIPEKEVVIVTDPEKMRRFIRG